jgi:hypothetical protein
LRINFSLSDLRMSRAPLIAAFKLVRAFGLLFPEYLLMAGVCLFGKRNVP